MIAVIKGCGDKATPKNHLKLAYLLRYRDNL